MLRNQTTDKTKMATARFGSASVEEIDEKKQNANAKRTLQSNKLAANVFREYLTEKGLDSKFEDFDVSILDGNLANFYIDARKKDGSKYKSGSLECIRHGLNRYLKAPPFNKKFDIIKDSSFRDSNQTYEAARADLKQSGLGSTTHYPEIHDDDLHKLYSSMFLSQSTPSGLSNKVQFDIRMYFCRRGAENMHLMTKSTFSIKTDPESGLRYVTKSTDELSKNHRGNDKESTSGSMPEMPGMLTKFYTKLYMYNLLVTKRTFFKIYLCPVFTNYIVTFTIYQ